MSFLIRLVIRLLARSLWGRIVLCAILVLFGIAIGASSQQVNYIQSSNNTQYEVSTGHTSGNLYLHASGSDEYYVGFNSDFTVSQDVLNNFASVNFIARSDTSTLDNPLNTSNGSTINDAHKIEKIVFMDGQGNVLATYTASEYTANPNGFYNNEWLPASAMIVLGLVILVVPLFWTRLRKKQQANAGFAIAGSVAPPYPAQQPYGQPPYPPQQPYGQPPYPPQQPQ